LNGRVITHQHRSPQCSAIELAPVYDAAREEGQRHGHDGRVTYLHGGLHRPGRLVRPPEIGTLDRVINVYPGWERLAGLAAGRAKRLFGLVYPRETRVVRLIIVAMNLMLRLQRKPVRAFFRVPATRSSGLSARMVSHLTSRRTSAPRERSPVSPRMNQPRGVTKLQRGFRWKASSTDDDQG
jgi:hypothetical protein